VTPFLTKLIGRLPIGWLQLIHNRTRLIAAIGGVTFANVLIFMQLGFMNALFETSVFTHRSLRTDIVLVSSDFRSLREANPLPRSRMYQALSHPEVRDATPVYIGTSMWTDTESGDTTNFRVMGFDPDHTIFTDPKLNNSLRLLKEADSAIVDRRTRDFRKPIETQINEVGRYSIEMANRTIALVDTFSQGASFDVDGSLIVSDQTFLRLFPRRHSGAPTLVLVTLHDATQAERIARELNHSFPESDTHAFTKDQWVQSEQSYQARQTPIGFVFGFGVVIGMVVGLVIVYQVLSTDVQDHMAEYATFKAIGYPPKFFMGIVFEESISLATLGFLPGMCLSLVLYQLASSKTGLPISMPLGRLLFVFVLTSVMCILSGAIATKRLNSADPAELF
jgi:putative ABC transport system permease protein